MLNGRDYPHVVEYIGELREQKERMYGVTLMGQLERFHQLSRGAEDAGQFSAAVNAEKIEICFRWINDRSKRKYKHNGSIIPR